MNKSFVCVLGSLLVFFASSMAYAAVIEIDLAERVANDCSSTGYGGGYNRFEMNVLPKGSAIHVGDKLILRNTSNGNDSWQFWDTNQNMSLDVNGDETGNQYYEFTAQSEGSLRMTYYRLVGSRCCRLPGDGIYLLWGTIAP